ncbi:hypothetical protein F2Q69_00042234 [Brassica cretica]|uniref:Uncharacterized protein n=1 Tax=Brassica cretica TaxID=69181 RepID=A0A8S9NHV1_BRACR|nr:hypothetical protein F2Q69_00042234 [Brassica cretica]
MTSGSNHRNFRVPTTISESNQRFSGLLHRRRAPVSVPRPREKTSGSQIKDLVDEMLPHGGDWSELAGSLMENYTRPQSRQDFSLHFLRVSESCGGVYGSGPKNSERENIDEAED